MGAMKLRCVRGMHDWLPDQEWRHRFLMDRIAAITLRFGYRPMRTPIVEHSSLFTTMLGRHTDVVHKEMYGFCDRGGENLSLRPEGTAGIVRSFAASPPPPLPWKVFYAGPMFRRERPQKGRLRQFHQAGVEMLGLRDPRADAEIITMAKYVLDDLDLRGTLSLRLNFLGGHDTRKRWRSALTDYLTPLKSDLSADSSRRLDHNPLRILDSKNEKDRLMCRDAPLVNQFWTDSEKDFFDRVQHHLAHLGIEFTLAPRLVRGLDYYCDTAFEFENSDLGAQATVLAGGRYDPMVRAMGGSEDTAFGIGWAAGIERLALLSDPPPEDMPLVQIAAMDTDLEDRALYLACDLRRQGIRVAYSFGGSLTKILRRAAAAKIRFVVILGAHESHHDRVIVRDLVSAGQVDMDPLDLYAYLSRS